jgi:hypothetical protein
MSLVYSIVNANAPREENILYTFENKFCKEYLNIREIM